MDNNVNIVFNEPYVKDLLQDLANKNVIQILNKEREVIEHEIPEWQKEETRRRMEVFHKKPTDVHTLENVEM